MGDPKTALGGESYLIWLVIFVACVAAVGWFFAPPDQWYGRYVSLGRVEHNATPDGSL
jgi:hypothetical protein